MILGGINDDSFSIGREEIADSPRNQIQILMNERRRSHSLGLLLDALPKFGEETEVPLNLSLAAAFRDSTQNESTMLCA